MSRRILSLVLVATLLACASPVRSQGVDGRAGPAAAPAPVAKPGARAYALLIPREEAAPIPSRVLPALDNAALRAQDLSRASGGDKALRSGIARDLRVTPVDGRWDRLPGLGWLWRIELVSTGASGIRAHLAGMNLAPGTQVRFYPTSDPTRLWGPFSDHGPAGDGEFWAPVVSGDHMVIEYFVPGSDDEPPSATPFLIDQVMHVYRSPFDPAGDLLDKEGNCHNDVTCYPAWASLSHAVARIDYVSGGNGFLCTGQLLNTIAGDLTPYFLTANHCISSAASAASATIYWDYQTPSCGGAVPALGSVPTSAVCTLLSNNASSDYSLLMVEGVLPGGRYWSGWQPGGTLDGTLVAGIHHPAGTYKRISFGTKGATGTANHIRSNWYSGVTEGGSSGSGLFRQDNQRLVGQLHGGPSACGGASLYDDYGDFAVTYPAISGFLNAGSDDGFEPDESCGAPAFIASGSWVGLIVKNTSEDWYNVFVGANQRLTVSLSFTSAYGDIDMAVFDGCGAQLGGSFGTGNSEQVDWYNTGAGRNVRIRVYLFNDTRNNYNMTVSVAAFPNLNATATPGGFTFPVVPRKTNDAGFFNAVLPPTLDGNTSDTYENWSMAQEGPGAIPTGWDARLYIDNVWSWAFSFGPGLGPTSIQALNLGPDNIRGGRHTMVSYADYSNTAVESNESDNTWSGQWVWSPLLTSTATPLTRAAPPDRGPFALPNSDGFQYNRTPGYAWVTAVAPTIAGDDYDLYVYDDYSGSLSGFSNLVGSSTYGSTYTDFVVGHYSGTPTTMYSAAVRYLAGTGTTCLVDQNDAVGRNGSGSYALYPAQLLAANRLADVYEFYMTSGSAYRFALTRLSGSSDIAFAIYPGTAGVIYGRSSMEGASVVASADLDTAEFNAPTTGWHPVVVYRDKGDGAANDVGYTLAWGTGVLVDVPPTAEHFDLAFLGASPNPVGSNTRLGFTLPKSQTVRLSLFDLGGRRVRALADGAFETGRHELPWDGRDDAGSRLGAGVYWARFESEGHAFSRRVVVMR